MRRWMGNKRSMAELISAYLASVAYVFTVLIGTGTLTYGYHLIDDHEILLKIKGKRSHVDGGRSEWPV